MSEFFKTRMGHKFFEGDVPRIATALEKIAYELDRANGARELAEDVGPDWSRVGALFMRWAQEDGTADELASVATAIGFDDTTDQFWAELERRLARAFGGARRG